MLFVSCRYSLAFRDIVLVAGIISKLEIQITNPIQQICNTYGTSHLLPGGGAGYIQGGGGICFADVLGGVENKNHLG